MVGPGGVTPLVDSRPYLTTPGLQPGGRISPHGKPGRCCFLWLCRLQFSQNESSGSPTKNPEVLPSGFLGRELYPHTKPRGLMYVGYGSMKSHSWDVRGWCAIFFTSYSSLLLLHQTTYRASLSICSTNLLISLCENASLWAWFSADSSQQISPSRRQVDKSWAKEATSSRRSRENREGAS